MGLLLCLVRNVCFGPSGRVLCLFESFSGLAGSRGAQHRHLFKTTVRCLSLEASWSSRTWHRKRKIMAMEGPWRGLLFGCAAEQGPAVPFLISLPCSLNLPLVGQGCCGCFGKLPPCWSSPLPVAVPRPRGSRSVTRDTRLGTQV